MENAKKNYLEMKADVIGRNVLSSLRTEESENCVYVEEKRYRADGNYQRDYARIMYSSSFRRLQGKMQLLGIQNDQFFRNRLTHSLEVAQVARSIATTLKYDTNEIYVVEAGALAHDLGNPPFGHAGERYMDQLFEECGGFEGNAQTLRILTNIEKKRPNFRGLNLTYRTMFGVTKYFRKREENEEKYHKFIYDNDYDMLKEFSDITGIAARTMDVQIVDIADEIAYAAHDLEDGLRVKAFTIDEILHDMYIRNSGGEAYNKLEEMVKRAKEKAGYGKNYIDSSQYSKMFRQELASSLINLVINDIDFINISEEYRKKTGTTNKQELRFAHYGDLVNGLKETVFQCINHNDEVYHYEKRGKEVLKFLKEHFVTDSKYLPPEYRAELMQEQYEDLRELDRKKLQMRLVCDYIAGMMDTFAIAVYEKFSGKKF